MHRKSFVVNLAGAAQLHVLLHSNAGSYAAATLSHQSTDLFYNMCKRPKRVSFICEQYSVLVADLLQMKSNISSLVLSLLKLITFYGVNTLLCL